MSISISSKNTLLFVNAFPQAPTVAGKDLKKFIHPQEKRMFPHPISILCNISAGQYLNKNSLHLQELRSTRWQGWESPFCACQRRDLPHTAHRLGLTRRDDGLSQSQVLPMDAVKEEDEGSFGLASCCPL